MPLMRTSPLLFGRLARVATALAIVSAAVALVVGMSVPVLPRASSSAAIDIASIPTTTTMNASADVGGTWYVANPQTDDIYQETGSSLSALTTDWPSVTNISALVGYDSNLYAAVNSGGNGSVWEWEGVASGGWWPVGPQNSWTNTTSLAVYTSNNQSKLYVGVGVPGGDLSDNWGNVLEYEGGWNWETVSPGGWLSVNALASYGGFLFAGTGNWGAAGAAFGAGSVQVYNGQKWVSQTTGLEPVSAFDVFDGSLYLGEGTLNYSDGAVDEYDATTGDWTTRQSGLSAVTALADDGSTLYAGIFDPNETAIATTDGTSWQPVNASDFGIDLVDTEAGMTVYSCDPSTCPSIVVR